MLEKISLLRKTNNLLNDSKTDKIPYQNNLWIMSFLVKDNPQEDC